MVIMMFRFTIFREKIILIMEEFEKGGFTINQEDERWRGWRVS